MATFPNPETAHQISRVLIEEHLAACVNILPGALSIYHWDGKVMEEQEVVAFFKTSTIHRGKFQQRLMDLHPAEVPECVMMEVLDGSPKYLNWVRSEVLLGNWRKPTDT
ncbi:MAG TPA: divalent-cation tolerance protein CutA [Chthoniobacterales bacterium]